MTAVRSKSTHRHVPHVRVKLFQQPTMTKEMGINLFLFLHFRWRPYIKLEREENRQRIESALANGNHQYL